VEARVKELSRTAARALGISRRQFLAGTGGMAATFLAINEVFGAPFFYRLPAGRKAVRRGEYRPVPADYEARIPDELKTIMEFPEFAADAFTRMRAEYQAAGGLPSNTRYGCRTRA
jgi:hypothetical protein